MRYDPIQRRWVIIAPERDSRPRDATVWASAALAGEDCPFCPGNEAMTPPEILAEGRQDSLPADGPGWNRRVVPNRYPALTEHPAAAAEVEAPGGLFVTRAGEGRHEVLIESARHDVDLADLAVGDLEAVLRLWRERMREICADEGIAHCLVFRNRGPGAGATLAHPHTQILGLPVVPLTVAREVGSVADHRRRTGRCLFCDILAAEEVHRRRVVTSGDEFVALAPWASRFAAEVQILPRRHRSCFTEATDDEVAALAPVLGDICRRLRAALDDPDYNLVLHSVCGHERLEASPDYHWHVEILPRLGRLAGFEAGGGMTINPLAPEEAAQRLRSVEIESR